MEILETKELSDHLRVVVVVDPDPFIDNHLGEEPVAIFQVRKPEVFAPDMIYDQTLLEPSHFQFARQMEIMCFLPDGFDVENDVPDRFPMHASAAEFYMFAHDIRCKRIDTCHRETYFVSWSQKALDEYAGIKDAEAPIETIRCVAEGDVYGYVVQTRPDTSTPWADTGESCWAIADIDAAQHFLRSADRNVEGV
jgi:hypothetical protein